MLFSVEQAFVGRDEKRDPLKTPAWEATASCDDAVKCGICHLWIHGKCNGLTIKDCKRLKLNNEVFFCKICTIDLFPFSSLNDIEFNILMNSRKPSDIELLPSLDIISKITSLGSLNISDIESNIPNPINSKNYYPSDFDKLALHVSSSPSYFSLFHVNLNSLDAHLGGLQTILALMNSPFHVLGISETRENCSSGFKVNNNLDGYILHSQPSRSAAGGVK